MTGVELRDTDSEGRLAGNFPAWEGPLPRKGEKITHSGMEWKINSVVHRPMDDTVEVHAFCI